MGTIATLVTKLTADTANFKQGMNQAESTTASATSGIKNNLTMIGGAIAGAGVALEGFAQMSKDTNIAMDQLAVQTDHTAGELRSMTSDLTDATFAQDEVITTLEHAQERGLESADAMKEYATAWDTVADASGESVEALSENSAALQAIGIDASETEEAFDAFGFVISDTSQDVNDFLNFIERTGPELREMEMDVDDAAAVIGALEGELGMAGRTARTEFRQAVNEADGDLKEALDTLGLTEEQFQSYRAEVEGSEGDMRDMADAVYDNQTVFDHLRSSVSDVMLHLSPLASVAGGLSPVLTTLGTSIMGLNQAKMLWATTNVGSLVPSLTAATASAWGFVTAAGAAVAPILPIIAVVAALGVGLYALISNWDEVSTALGEGFEWLRDIAGETIGAVIDFFGDLPGQAVEHINSFTDSVGEGMSSAYDSAVSWAGDTVSGIVDTVSDLPAQALDVFTGFGADLFEWATDTREGMIEWTGDMATGIVDRASEIPGDVLGIFTGLGSDLMGWFGDMANDSYTAMGDVANSVLDAVVGLPGDLYNSATSMISDFVSGIRDGIPSVSDAASSVADAVRDFLPFSPAKEGPLSDMPDFGSYLSEGVQGSDKDADRDIEQAIAGIKGKMDSEAQEDGLSLEGNDSGRRSSGQGRGSGSKKKDSEGISEIPEGKLGMIIADNKTLKKFRRQLKEAGLDEAARGAEA